MCLKKYLKYVMLILLFCSAISCSQRIHHPAGAKKRQRDCDCPKWTNINQPDTMFAQDVSTG